MLEGVKKFAYILNIQDNVWKQISLCTVEPMKLLATVLNQSCCMKSLLLPLFSSSTKGFLPSISPKV